MRIMSLDHSLGSCMLSVESIPWESAMTNAAAVSFEFFPPSDESMGLQLWNCVQRLAPLQPDFVSVIYGADGSTRTRTHECVLRILRETNLTVAPHLTCVGASRPEVLKIAQ